MKAGMTAVLAGWLLVAGGGSLALARYKNIPGAASVVATVWPGLPASSLSPSRPTLVIFAHPRCPCTEATMAELDLLLTHCAGRITTKIVFFQPPAANAEWTGTTTWRAAASLPGVETLTDEGGVAARRFGATTSGHAFLYDQAGKLLFNGGITPSRGHQGDNLGRAAIESLVLHGNAPSRETPVYGCSLTRMTNGTENPVQECRP